MILPDPCNARWKPTSPTCLSGCLVKLERLAKDYVLQNIRQNLRSAKSRMVEAIAEDTEQLGRVPGACGILRRHQLEPDDLYRRDSVGRAFVSKPACNSRFTIPTKSA